MDYSAEKYFSRLESFKRLHHDLISVSETLGVDAVDMIANFDIFAAELSKLASDKFRISTNDVPLIIGIVGEYNTGKSSLINSLIGIDLLGIADLPATSKITILSYKNISPPEIYKVRKSGHAERTSYDEYLTFGLHQHYQHNNSEFSEDISHFEIHHNAEQLKNFQLVDTPGFSSKSKEDDETTKNYLDKVDLLLWVFNAVRGSINAEELNLLKSVGNKKIIGVINRIDDQPPSSRSIVIDEFRKKFDFYEVIPYSATNALDYQKDILFNTDAYNKIILQIKDQLNHKDNLTVERIKGKLQIINGEEIIYQAAIKEIDKDNEFINYHNLLISILQKIREEISFIKENQFREELLLLFDKELQRWKANIIELQLTLDEWESILIEEETEASTLLIILENRASEYIEKLQNELPELIFNRIYEFDYKGPSWLESEKRFVRIKDISKNYEIILEDISNIYDEVHDSMISDILQGISNAGIEFHSDDIELLRLLKKVFIQIGYDSVFAMYGTQVDYASAYDFKKTKEILLEKINLAIPSFRFCHLTVMFATKMIVNQFEAKQSVFLRSNKIVKSLKETIIQTLDEK